MLKLQPTQRLIQTLGLGSLAFLGIGFVLRYVVQQPEVTVVIDRSYCPPNQWQERVVTPYADLYQQSQANQLQIKQVVIVTDIDQIILPDIPAPEALGNPFGQVPEPETIEVIQETFPGSIFFRCEIP